MNLGLLKRHVKRTLSTAGVIDPGDKWAIGIYEGPSPLHLDDVPGVVNPVLSWRSVTDVPASFLADPFMVRSGSRWQMFFEVWNRSTGKGEIGLAISEDGLSWQYEQIVLAEPFHLSYPHIVQVDGQHYMLPESNEDGAVHLYRALEYPYTWTRESTLLTGHSFSDPTVVCVRNRWYMFVETSPSGASDTLRLYHAERLQGPWHEHPKSPLLVFDPYGARPAGPVVADGSKLIRLSQTCYPSYGQNVRAFEITELSPTTYSERGIRSTPVLEASGQGWNGRGMHHMDAHQIAPGRWRACVDGYSMTSARNPWRKQSVAAPTKPRLELVPPTNEDEGSRAPLHEGALDRQAL